MERVCEHAMVEEEDEEDKEDASGDQWRRSTAPGRASPRATPTSPTAQMTSSTPGGLLGWLLTLHLPLSLLMRLYKVKVATQLSAEDNPKEPSTACQLPALNPQWLGFIAGFFVFYS